MPTLLLAGDFAAHTGLSRVNEALAAQLAARGWDVAVLAINYHGDATPLQTRYQLYPAAGGGDAHGVGRIAAVAAHVQPDALLLVHDPWIVSAWLRELGDGAPPAVAYLPVDGTGLNGAHVEPLNGLNAAIAYTSFGREQLRAAGLTAPCHILPHGIDRELFYPVEQAAARQQLGMDADTYAVLLLDANQPRKRLDLAFAAFAAFAADKPETVRLVYHGPPLTPNGWDVQAMAADLGIEERLLLSSRHITPTRGVKPEHLRVVYSACDVKLTTTSGEGWGMTTHEAMACGLPCVVPAFAALGEWARPAALCVPAPIALRHCGAFEGAGTNTIGRVPTVEAAAAALEQVYQDAGLRADLRAAGLLLASDGRYDWSNIGAAFNHVLQDAITIEQAVAADLEVAA